MADGVDITAGSGTTIASDEITTVNGGAVSARHAQRIKLDAKGTDGAFTDVAASAPLPVFPQHTGRTFVQYWATGAAAGTTGTETLITMTKSPGVGSATATTSSATPTSGKRFRITSLTFACRGHATATVQITTFSLRVNTAGATTTTSNPVIQARVATPATSLAWDRIQFFYDDMGYELTGDGTLTFGVSANAVYTTNAPTWDIAITGYEYTP